VLISVPNIESRLAAPRYQVSSDVNSKDGKLNLKVLYNDLLGELKHLINPNYYII